MKYAKVKLNYLKCNKLDKCLRHTEHAEDGCIIDEFVFIENREDLKKYEDLLLQAVGQQIVKCLRSALFPDKVDHMLGAGDIGTQLLAVAYYKASAHQVSHPEPHILNNPIFGIESAARLKIGLLQKFLNNDNKPLVNKSGGFMWYEPERMEILNVYDREPESSVPKPYLRNDNKIIVLENDWELPRESVKFLDAKVGWGNYSIVKGLREYSKQQLVDLLKRFKADGGEEVFVYTTGIDVPQMFDYTEAVIESGLTKLYLFFTGGTTNSHTEYFKKFNPLLNITILGSL